MVSTFEDVVRNWDIEKRLAVRPCHEPKSRLLVSKDHQKIEGFVNIGGNIHAN